MNTSSKKNIAKINANTSFRACVFELDDARGSSAFDLFLGIYDSEFVDRLWSPAWIVSFAFSFFIWSKSV